MQGPANSKSKNLVDKEVDQLDSNDCHVNNENGCVDLTNDIDVKGDISAKIEEEDAVNETSANDEHPPPLKKPKCATEKCCPGRAEGVYFSLAFYLILIFP